jgi:hypothetical protein
MRKFNTFVLSAEFDSHAKEYSNAKFVSRITFFIVAFRYEM